MKTIIFCDGGKGGVGKSFVAIALADYLMRKAECIACIDADPTNPDVVRLFQEQEDQGVYTATYDLSETDDWMAFLESLESLPEDLSYIIVSLPAALNITPHLPTALGVFEALGMHVMTFFMLNRQSDSINLLGHSLKGGLLHSSAHKVAILNGVFGREEQFDRWQESTTRKQFTKSGGLIVYMPELYFKSVDLALVTHHRPFSQVKDLTIPLVYRAQITQWLKAIDTTFDHLFEAKS